MPAIAALTINDGATTPVAHVFSPVSTNGAKAEWADRTASMPTAYLTISDEVRKPATATAAYRKITGFNNPVVADVNGVDTVVRNSSAQLTLNFAPTSTIQERKDLLAYIAGWCANADVKESIENIEPFY